MIAGKVKFESVVSRIIEDRADSRNVDTMGFYKALGTQSEAIGEGKLVNIKEESDGG